MIASLVAGLVLGGTGCNVVVSNRAAHVYSTPVYQAAAINYNYTPYVAKTANPYYVTYSALAYVSDDPDKAAYRRQNEILTRSLAAALEAERDRSTRLENALAQSTPPGAGDGGEGPPVPARNAGPNAAFGVLQRACLSCHGEGKSAASHFTLAPYPNLAQRLLINQVVNVKKTMPPPDKPKLSDADRKALSDWAEVSFEELKRSGSTATANDPPPQQQKP